MLHYNHRARWQKSANECLARRVGQSLVILSALVLLVGCSGGQSELDLQPPVPTGIARGQAAGSVTPDSAASVKVEALALKASRRISRTVFEYDFEVTLLNQGQLLGEVQVLAANAGAGTSIVDGAIQFASLPHGATTAAFDTVTLRHDRTYPFNASALLWKITGVAHTSAMPGNVYLEADGVVAGEAEVFSRRTSSSTGKAWLVIPDESGGAGGALFGNARAGRYIQALPDNDSGGGFAQPPTVEYRMKINTPGTYRLFVRWAGYSFGSDSMFVDLVELKDGTGGAIADWYQLGGSSSGDFAVPGWNGMGGSEQNQAVPATSPLTWTIAKPGLYTLRMSQREDGAAVDAFVFQLSLLPAPGGDGPQTSSVHVDRALLGESVALRYDAGLSRLIPADLTKGALLHGENLADFARLKGLGADVPVFRVAGIQSRWYVPAPTGRKELTAAISQIFGFNPIRLRFARLDGQDLAFAYSEANEIVAATIVFDPGSGNLAGQLLGGFASSLIGTLGFAPVDLVFTASTPNPAKNDDTVLARRQNGELREYKWADIKRGVSAGVSVDLSSVLGDPSLTSTVGVGAFDLGAGEELYAIRLARFVWRSGFDADFAGWTHAPFQQGGLGIVIDDPTASGKGRLLQSTIGGGSPPIDEGSNNNLVYRLYPGIYFPFVPAPCYTRLDAWASQELVGSASQASNNVIVGPDVFSINAAGTYVSAVQAVIRPLPFANGAMLRLFHWPPGELGTPEVGVPQFTPGQWHTVRTFIDADGFLALHQDEVLAGKATVTSEVRPGTVGGHPGIYAGSWAVTPTPLVGRLLIDNYEIKCW